MKKTMLVLGMLLALAAYAPAQEISVVSGKLLGHDDKPMRKAHVNLLPNKYAQQSLQTIEVVEDGSFEIQFKDTGLLYLKFTGVNHHRLLMPLLVEKPLREKLAVRLKLYEYVDDLSKVKIVGDFNNFDFSSAQPMTSQADGTFLFEMDTTANTFAYQIVGAVKQYSINGTQSDDFVLGDWNYRSLVKVNNGKVKIIFDPKKLVRGKPSDKDVVQFENPNSFQAQFYSLAQEQMQRQDKWFAARKAYMDTHQNDMSGFTYDYSAELMAFPKRIAKEKSSTLRQMLLLQYLDLERLGDHEKLDKKLIKQAFAEISATSLLWELSPYLMMEAVQWSDEPGKYDNYLNQALEKYPDRSLRVNILSMKLDEATAKYDTTNAKIYFSRLMKDFGDTEEAQWAKNQYDPNRAIMKGKKAPVFSVTSMDQSGVIYTNESMKGKIYLLDFWAVWCPPCIAEMPNLHQTYENFKDKNFEILSLSFDYQAEDVAKFRSGQWKMPWLHTFVEGGFPSDLAKAFEVQGIPKPILVDGDTNTILANEEELRREQLEKTLAKVLGEKTAVGNADKR